MNEKTLLWLILAIVAVDLYIDYRVASALQGVSDKVQKPLGFLGEISEKMGL